MSSNIQAQLNLANYKFENGDYAEAQIIFENIALNYNYAEAWEGLGKVKFTQLFNNESNVKHCLAHFGKAVYFAPHAKSLIQGNYISYSTEALQVFCQLYIQARKQSSGAGWKKAGNLLLVGLSLFYGAEGKNSFANSLITAAGAGYGGVSAFKNTQIRRASKESMGFYRQMIIELVLGVKNFAEDHAGYISFVNTVKQISSADGQLTEIFNSRLVPLLRG